MNITEANAVDKVLAALAQITAFHGLALREEEKAAAQLLRERAAKPLLVSPDAIGRVRA